MRKQAIQDKKFSEYSGKSLPTVSQWGLVVMTLLLAMGGKVYFGRRRAMRT